MKTVGEIVKESKNATFVRYRKGFLYFKTSAGFEFPVPIEDLGDATINSQEKTLMLMRYIRKHVLSIKEEKENEAIKSEIIAYDNDVNVSQREVIAPNPYHNAQIIKEGLSNLKVTPVKSDSKTD